MQTREPWYIKVAVYTVGFCCLPFLGLAYLLKTPPPQGQKKLHTCQVFTSGKVSTFTHPSGTDEVNLDMAHTLIGFTPVSYKWGDGYVYDGPNWKASGRLAIPNTVTFEELEE